jgi:hypothetical protein
MVVRSARYLAHRGEPGGRPWKSPSYEQDLVLDSGAAFLGGGGRVPPNDGECRVSRTPASDQVLSRVRFARWTLEWSAAT